VVTTNVPNLPLAQTTRLFTALTEMSELVVPLVCRVTLGPFPLE
jgi:hypothetical protein